MKVQAKHPRNLKHRASCHRCGNMRANAISCKECPYIYCKQCHGKMTEVHGLTVFEGGCPVCKDLCCCGSNRSIDCNQKYHCYKKCLSMKSKPSSYSKHGFRTRAMSSYFDADTSDELLFETHEKRDQFSPISSTKLFLDMTKGSEQTGGNNTTDNRNVTETDGKTVEIEKDDSSDAAKLVKSPGLHHCDKSINLYAKSKANIKSRGLHFVCNATRPIIAPPRSKLIDLLRSNSKITLIGPAFVQSSLVQTIDQLPPLQTLLCKLVDDKNKLIKSVLEAETVRVISTQSATESSINTTLPSPVVLRQTMADLTTDSELEDKLISLPQKRKRGRPPRQSARQKVSSQPSCHAEIDNKRPEHQICLHGAINFMNTSVNLEWEECTPCSQVSNLNYCRTIDDSLQQRASNEHYESTTIDGGQQGYPSFKSSAISVSDSSSQDRQRYTQVSSGYESGVYSNPGSISSISEYCSNSRKIRKGILSPFSSPVDTEKILQYYLGGPSTPTNNGVWQEKNTFDQHVMGVSPITNEEVDQQHFCQGRTTKDCMQQIEINFAATKRKIAHLDHINDIDQNPEAALTRLVPNEFKSLSPTKSMDGNPSMERMRPGSVITPSKPDDMQPNHTCMTSPSLMRQCTSPSQSMYTKSTGLAATSNSSNATPPDEMLLNTLAWIASGSLESHSSQSTASPLTQENYD